MIIGGLVMNKKRLIVLIGLLCLVAAASPLILNKVSPSRALAPSIFISYDDEGIESRIFFYNNRRWI